MYAVCQSLGWKDISPCALTSPTNENTAVAMPFPEPGGQTLASFLPELLCELRGEDVFQSSAHVVCGPLSVRADAASPQFSIRLLSFDLSGFRAL